MEIRPGIYKHFKGNLYYVIGIATHTENDEPMVVYAPLYESKSKYWTRPASMWNDHVEKGDYSGPRFVFVESWDGPALRFNQMFKKRSAVETNGCYFLEEVTVQDGLTILRLGGKNTFQDIVPLAELTSKYVFA